MPAALLYKLQLVYRLSKLLVILVGIVPFNSKFYDKSKYSSWESRPSSDGSVPVKEL